MKLRGTLARAGLLALIALAPAACAYSSYSTARMLPPGGTSVGAAITSYGIQGGGGGGDEEAIELMASRGLSDKLELGGKLSWFLVENNNTFDLLVVPKYSLIPDQLALTVPAGLILVTGEGNTENAWLLMPGLVFTKVLNEYFELDIAGKPVIGFQDDFGDYDIAVAGNLGVRLTPPGARWGIHPEVGVMWDEDLDESDIDYYLQLGVAVYFEMGPTRAAPGKGTGN